MSFGNRRVRITGVGPWSAQWEYLETNHDVARRVLVDLEDRRVLFHRRGEPDATGRRDPEHCRRSVDEIRRLMTEELSRVEQGDDMDQALRAIRAAARRFIDQAGPDSVDFIADLESFWRALEEMRSAMAPHIRSMAMAYGVLVDPVFEENLPRHEMTKTTVVD